MKPEMIDQLIFWAISGSGLIVCTLLGIIGRFIVAEVRSAKDETIKLRSEFGTDLTKLRHEFSVDMGSIRERIAKIEGAVFPSSRRTD